MGLEDALKTGSNTLDLLSAEKVSVVSRVLSSQMKEVETVRKRSNDQKQESDDDEKCDQPNARVRQQAVSSAIFEEAEFKMGANPKLKTKSILPQNKLIRSMG